MAWDRNGEYIPEDVSLGNVSLERMLRSAKEMRIKQNLANFKKESDLLMAAFGKTRDCPPIPSTNFSYARSVMLDQDRQMLAWCCFQVAARDRGEIGFTEKGEMVFHIILDRTDHQEHLDMCTMDEVWIVLDPPKSLTSAYGG